jgi:fatty-acyl-CoA synthase
VKHHPPSAPDHFTLVEALAAAAGSRAGGLTFVEPDEREHTLDWVEVQRRARRTAAGLIAAGIGPGDRVAIVLPTAPSFLDAFFGAILVGAVPVPLYPPVRLGRFQEYEMMTGRMLESVGACILLTDRRLLPLLGGVAAAARPELGLREVGSLRAGSARGDEGADQSRGPRHENGPRADDLALIQFSSGTTREPRPVALTHRAVTTQCAALKQLLRPADATPQRGVSWLPLYHDMGLIGTLLTALTWPGPLVLIRPESFLVQPALWLRAISRHRATISAAPAFAYGLCARRIEDRQLQGCDLSCWRVALCGAEPIPPEVLDGFADRFAAQGMSRNSLTPAYGLAEATLAVTASLPGGGPRSHDFRDHELDRGGAAEALPGGGASTRRLLSCGPPLPGIQVEVRDDRGSPLPGGRCGRIFVRSPSLMAGYFSQPGPTAEVLADGWLDTGDLGLIRDGELFICGRARDLIILRGANHAPEEFEECLRSLPEVRPGRALAVGYQPAGADGEVLLMLVEHAGPAGPDGPALDQRISEEVQSCTGVRPYAVHVLAPGTLPRTSSGKLRRQEALRRFLAGELTPPGRVGPWFLGRQVLRSAVALARLRLGR